MASHSRPADPITVNVPGASYHIFVEEGLLSRTGEYLQPLIAGRRVFVVSDTKVWNLWGKQLSRALAGLTKRGSSRQPLSVILMPPGERHKRLVTVEKIASELAVHGAERSSIVLAFGGGVVGDMAGFVASSYLRGIDYVQIPTTLLAQVDSAIGGKTGVNLAVGKNLVGAFYQPKLVLSDPRLLRTLPPRELRAGLFEAIKCAVIGDPELFNFLVKSRREVLQGKTAAIERVVRASAALKALIVSKDEKEGDLRRVLNFGHTVGHALEAATRYRRFLHGEAVAWGMLAATQMALQTDGLAPEEARRMTELICSYGPVPSIGKIPAADVCRHMAVDKKVRDGVVHFVLPRRVGEVSIVKGIPQQRVVSIIEDLKRNDPFRST